MTTTLSKIIQAATNRNVAIIALVLSIPIFPWPLAYSHSPGYDDLASLREIRLDCSVSCAKTDSRDANKVPCRAKLCKYLRASLRRTGFTITMNDTAPLLSVTSREYYTGGSWVYLDHRKPSVLQIGLSTIATLKRGTQSYFEAKHSWPTYENPETVADELVGLAVMIDLAVHGARMQSILSDSITQWQDEEPGLWRAAVMEISRTGDPAIPVLRSMIAKGDIWGAPRVLTAIGSAAALRVALKRLHPKAFPQGITGEECEGIKDASSRLSPESLEMLRQVYQEDPSLYCRDEIKDVLTSHRVSVQ
jgi:hypothetical protein